MTNALLTYTTSRDTISMWPEMRIDIGVAGHVHLQLVSVRS
jgi:hypothetical protein